METLPPRLCVAGTHSGAGKTTLVAGLIAAYRKRGQVVQPFKVGPDYIDPSYHTLAAGRTCRNLDAWLLSPDALRSSFLRGSRGAGLAIIEGVMGLYDGFGYEDDTGSTASVAKLLGAAVVLVLDISSMARSGAALARGFTAFDPDLPWSGFILNYAANASHGEGVARAVTAATGLPCFGWLPREQRLNIPERHLGLVPTAEPGRWEAFIDAAADHVRRHLDLDALLAAAGSSGRTPCDWGEEAPNRGPIASGQTSRPACTIAVARDEAFNFYYEDNLDLLREAGVELVFFSPLTARRLPAGCQGIYIGGGFPEVYAERLADNAELRGEIRRAIAGDIPTYAECGGLMYLTRSITDLDGRTYPMAGALPGRSVMAGRLTLGYREVIAERASVLAPGDRVCGARVPLLRMDRAASRDAVRLPGGWRERVERAGGLRRRKCPCILCPPALGRCALDRSTIRGGLPGSRYRCLPGR